MWVRIIINLAVAYYGFLITKLPSFPGKWPLYFGIYVIFVVAINWALHGVFKKRKQ